MSHVARQALRAGELPILLGTDCMDLHPQDLLAADRALEEGLAVIIGPAMDGGYYLLGLGRPLPALFRGICWGEAQVLDETLKTLRNKGMDYALLATRRDLDRPEDFPSGSPTLYLHGLRVEVEN